MAQGSTAQTNPCFLWNPEKRPRKSWAHALTLDGDPAVCACEPSEPIHYTRLQVVQRSLTGGYLTEDAALLNANVRSMFDEKLGRSLLTRTLRRRAAKRSTQASEAGCEL